MANVCGTGAWGGPLPGDPDNTSILSVAPAYGGIDVSWTLPFTNANAVSYVSVFRAAHNDPTLMVRRAVVGGDYFFDRILANEVREYFYWIQIVSINGTVGELIGPASTTPMLRIDEMLAALTGQIDQSLLAASLQTQLGEIPLLQVALNNEAAARLIGNTTMADALAAVQSETGQALTYIQQETQLRGDGDGVLLDSINVLAVGVAGTEAALVQEGIARADGDSSLAAQITTVIAQADGNTAAIQAEQTARADGDTALSSQVTTVQAIAESKGKVLTQSAPPGESDQLPQNLWIDTTDGANTPKRWNGLGWVTATDKIASDALAVTAINTAAIQTETTARATADTALAGQITTAQITLNGEIASVQTSLQTSIDTVNGNVTNIGALYTAKVGVNGLVGGFGIYNDATEVQAGFDVDTFWIGRTAANKRKPFIVSEDVVYIDDAAINKLTFSKLRDDVGSFIVEDGKVKADYITIGAASIGDAQIDRGSANKLQILSADIVDAQITAAKIQDLAVDTLKLAGQAVTIPVGVYTAAAVSLGLSQNGTGLLTLQTATITSTGAPIVITGAFRDSSTAGLDVKNLRIYRDATLLVNIAIDNTGGVYLYSFPFIDTPGVGTFVYTLKFYGDAGEFSIPTLTGSHRSLTLLEVKR